jgi:hypothetical protein
VGVYAFSSLADVVSYQVIMVGCSFVALTGTYVTWKFLDTPEKAASRKLRLTAEGGQTSHSSHRAGEEAFNPMGGDILQ